MVILREEEVEEAEVGLYDISRCCGYIELAMDIPRAPPGIGGGGGGGGGGGAGMLPGFYMLSGVFRRARVPQSKKKYEGD